MNFLVYDGYVLLALPLMIKAMSGKGFTRAVRGCNNIDKKF